MLTVVTHKTWRADFLGARSVPDDALVDTSTFVEGADGVWCPGHYAALLSLSGADWQFDDALWWTVSPELLGRHVVFCPDAEAVTAVFGVPDGASSGSFAGPERKFVKLARHKYGHFVAKTRTAGEFGAELSGRPFLTDHEFIVSDPVDIFAEHRVWVVDGEVAASSCYRLGPWTWGEGQSNPVVGLPPDHRDLALEATRQLGLAAAVVDTATLDSGRSIVIEANPPWSAGFYSAPREAVTATVLKSQGRNRNVPVFRPDAAATRIVRASPLLG